ncbi:hypothetical protein [uncultured Psychrobacter sp.]|uniref:hypothetical protein n=1 Tax=uncultured Psychrobacter sp. TaxID=259303 RepID=UPI0030D77D2A
MDNSEYTQYFGPNNIIAVSITNNGEAGESNANIIDIEAFGNKSTLEVSQTPSDHELQDTALWVKTTLQTALKDFSGNEVIGISGQVHRYLQQAITFRAMVAITSEKTQTDIEWINITFNGKKNRSDGRYHGWTQACLKKGNTDIKTFNAKELYQHLENHPGTPIYYSSEVEGFENCLLPEDRISFANKITLHDSLRMKTLAERVKAKLGATLDRELLFTKKGIYDAG